MREVSRRSLLAGVAHTLAATAGLLLALAGAVTPNGGQAGEPADAVMARVNGVAVTRAALERAVERVAGGNAGETMAAPVLRRRLLERLIDEELLVQRGLELGLIGSDRVIRRALVMEMIDTVVATARHGEPDPAALRAFHAANIELFSLPARVELQTLYVTARGDHEAATARLRRAVAAIDAGMPFERASRRFGDRPPVELPRGRLAVHVLRRYVGPTVTDAALAMAAGQRSEPLRVPAGYFVLKLVAKESGSPRPFRDVVEEVRREYRRRAVEEALSAFLAARRERAAVVLAADAPRLADASPGAEPERLAQAVEVARGGELADVAEGNR